MDNPDKPELDRGIAYRRFKSQMCAKDEHLAVLQSDGNWGSTRATFHTHPSLSFHPSAARQP